VIIELHLTLQQLLIYVFMTWVNLITEHPSQQQHLTMNLMNMTVRYQG